MLQSVALVPNEMTLSDIPTACGQPTLKSFRRQAFWMKTCTRNIIIIIVVVVVFVECGRPHVTRAADLCTPLWARYTRPILTSCSSRVRHTQQQVQDEFLDVCPWHTQILLNLAPLSPSIVFLLVGFVFSFLALTFGYIRRRSILRLFWLLQEVLHTCYFVLTA